MPVTATTAQILRDIDCDLDLLREQPLAYVVHHGSGGCSVRATSTRELAFLQGWSREQIETLAMILQKFQACVIDRVDRLVAEVEREASR